MAAPTLMKRPGFPSSARFDQLITIGLVVLAATPSVWWALSGPALLTDDYVLLARLRSAGYGAAIWGWAFEHPARPLVAPYFAAIYGLLGDRAELHALYLGLLNATVVVLLWRLGRRWIRADIALATALLYAVVPNRASTRLWFATSNYLASAIVVLLGAHLLFDRRRPAMAAAIFAAATLLFEGVVGLIGGIVVVWALQLPRYGRLRLGLGVLSPTACAALFVFLLSPKRGDGTNAMSGLDTVGHGLLGSGLWGPQLGAAGTFMITALIGLGIAGLLPSFATMRQRSITLRLGAMLLVSTTAPFVVAGAIFAVRGIFDRTNAIPLLALCLLLAGILPLADDVPRLRRRVVGIGLLACAYLFALNHHDVRDYMEAADTGRLVLDRIREDVPRDADLVVVGPPIEEGTGVASFVYASDIEAALRIRGWHSGVVMMPWSAEQCHEYAAASHGTGYDWRTRELLADASAVCGRQR